MAGLGESPNAPDFAQIEQGNARETANALYLVWAQLNLLLQSWTEMRVENKQPPADLWNNQGFGD